MILHRVFPWLPGVRKGAPGHALHVHRPQGAGRLDNPDRYDVLYLSDAAAGAVAEAFGSFDTWSAELFEGSPALPGSVRALAAYELSDLTPLADLDDPQRLVLLGLRPSQVVTRDRHLTQAWALRLFQSGSYDGARWWSYWDPRWSSLGLWQLDGLRLLEVSPLERADDHVEEAARILHRPWAPSPR